MNPDVLGIVATFCFGAAIGSFMNVCIYRLPLGKSLIWPGSHCPSCFQPVGPYNIPIFGYFILRGRCHECGEKFSIQYAAVEFFTAALLCFFYYRLVMVAGIPVGQFVGYGLFVCILIVASLIDLRWKIIPNQLNVVGVILALLFSAIYPGMHAIYIGYHESGTGWLDAVSRWVAEHPILDSLMASVAGMVAGVIVIVVIRAIGTAVFRREAMGLGDAKLMAVMGGFLGWKAIPLTFLVAAFIGAAVGIISYLRTRDHEIPLGPFLSVAALVVLLWGNGMVEWWCKTIMYLDWAPRVISIGMTAI